MSNQDYRNYADVTRSFLAGLHQLWWSGLPWYRKAWWLLWH